MFAAPVSIENMNYIIDPLQPNNRNRRGVNVYTASEIMGVNGIDKEGNVIRGQVQRPLFYLTIEERLEIFRLCAYVFGIVSGRMNKISCLDYTVTPKTKEEDKIYDHLKMCREVWNEQEDNTAGRVVQRRLWMLIRQEIIDIKPDLSNFDTAIRRW
ncbi:MAG: hypothetical protein ACM34O_15865, partial [Ignavibacteria bacterium]